MHSIQSICNRNSPFYNYYAYLFIHGVCIKFYRSLIALILQVIFVCQCNAYQHWTEYKSFGVSDVRRLRSADNIVT